MRKIYLHKRFDSFIPTVLVKNAHEEILTHYNSEVMAKNYASIYEEK